jgi:hypothetical protein
MAQNKTQPSRQKVSEFIAGIEDAQKRADCRELMKIMRAVTGRRATMWDPGIVGYGKYHYRYESGREVLTQLIRASVDFLREKYPVTS